jgi:hypothetical protein
MGQAADQHMLVFDEFGNQHLVPEIDEFVGLGFRGAHALNPGC